MYFTIKYLAPENYVPVIAWIDGKFLIFSGLTTPAAPFPHRTVAPSIPFWRLDNPRICLRVLANSHLPGWLNLIGQICGSASSSYGASQMLLSAVSIGSDFTYYPTQVCFDRILALPLFWRNANRIRATSLESWPVCPSSTPRLTV